MSLQKAPNSYLNNLVRRHASEILAQVSGTAKFIEEPEFVEEHSLPPSRQKSGTTSRAEGFPAVAKTTNKGKSEKDIKRSSFKDREPGKEQKANPLSQHSSNRSIRCPQKRLSASTATTDELTDLKSTATQQKEQKTRQTPANPLCGGIDGHQSSKDFGSLDSLVFACPKTISCKNIEKSPFDFHDDEEDLARLSSLPDLHPEFETRIKVLSYRTQVEKGLNYLVQLEVDEKRYLACIWERSDMCTSSLTRITEFK